MPLVEDNGVALRPAQTCQCVFPLIFVSVGPNLGRGDIVWDIVWDVGWDIGWDMGLDIGWDIVWDICKGHCVIFWDKFWPWLRVTSVARLTPLFLCGLKLWCDYTDFNSSSLR